jgi:hypothetical protein
LVQAKKVKRVHSRRIGGEFGASEVALGVGEIEIAVELIRLYGGINKYMIWRMLVLPLSVVRSTLEHPRLENYTRDLRIGRENLYRGLQNYSVDVETFEFLLQKCVNREWALEEMRKRTEQYPLLCGSPLGKWLLGEKS